MADDFNDHLDYLEEGRPRDIKFDEAKEILASELFAKDVNSVFYQRQIEVQHEDTFFHWITAKALNELAAERKIFSETKPLKGI